MKGTLLPLAAVVLVLTACGSSGVAIPKLDGCCLEQDYALLRSLHLRVSVEFLDRSTTEFDSQSGLGVEQYWPARGTQVARGSVVTLVARAGLAGSIVLLNSNPHYRLPNFVGRPATAAVRWATRHRVYWTVPRLPPLTASLARRLFAAYTVVAQRPKPGTVVGQAHRTRAGGVKQALTLRVRAR